MKRIVITPSRAGPWFYTVYIDGRVVVVGMSATRERAEVQAKLA